MWGLKTSLGAVALAPVYAMYTRRLRVLVRGSRPPHHVAVILDGNRRWANLAGMREPGAGHRRGASKLSELIGWCSELGIRELTVWALSTENLSRAKDEVAVLTEILSEELGMLGVAVQEPLQLGPRLLDGLEETVTLENGSP
jgi:undecaprenyl pyrophosphate synthase